MAVDTFSCPECHVKLRRSPHLQAGARVQCPKCRFQFPVPPPEEEAPADAVPTAPAADPAYPDAHGEPPAPAGSPRRDAGADHGERVGTAPRRGEERVAGDYDRRDGLRRADHDDEDYPHYPERGDPGELPTDYQIDLGLWFRHSFQHWSAVLGPFIGYTFLFLLIVVVLAVLI